MKERDSMETEAPLAPVTSQRKLRSDLKDFIPKPYLGRALVALDTDHPNGTIGHKNQGLSVLQQHAAFFDQNNDGIVYPWENDAGLDSFSCFSYIHKKNIHKSKHGSDSGAYDTEGRFMPVNLENMFSKYAVSVPDKMSLGEVWNMTEGNRVAFYFIGWIFSKVEWGILYIIAKDEDGYVSKEAVRGIFDGSFFEY